MRRIKEIKKLFVILFMLTMSFFVIACSDENGYDEDSNNSIVNSKWHIKYGNCYCVLEFTSKDDVIIYRLDSNNMYSDGFNKCKYVLDRNKITFQDLSIDSGFGVYHWYTGEVNGSLLIIKGRIDYSRWCEIHDVEMADYIEDWNATFVRVE